MIYILAVYDIFTIFALITNLKLSKMITIINGVKVRKQSNGKLELTITNGMSGVKLEAWISRNKATLDSLNGVTHPEAPEDESDSDSI